ncbi:uncharacterized protein LOC108160106 [Drosophila miranda]|uniref:uncharacterized protein LOC108160106 n=1 Tax=Drosophila miranda TaxID=7229 RepID=UPI0007E78B66|nr:uncharacterized protein LOC108160106 [Drosophila miranda]XP_017149387.1 uncharacterized protein LOC108160106 [Drosophila miranda]XP_033246961.1 uncharacterized protein LOC108160106 [Drosophila miranda]
MAATDGQIILAASRFGDATPVYLRDFSKQPLPAVAKILKGQHQALGVPTLSAPSLQSTALFLSAGKKYQILAQPIKIKEGRKPTNVGAKVLIPETYGGYFELLSEDGRSTRCIDSVLELSRRRNARVLVRETFRCQQMNRTIHAGELLTTMNDNGKYLQCRNIKDEIINLPLDTKAKFSAIAREDSISGVHTVKNLLLKRMPVIVRLVHGSAPKGLKQPFVPELRLLGCVEIDRIFALPLQKDTDLVPVPLNAKIKLQRVKNMEQLEHFIEYTRFLEKAQRLLADARDRLQIVDLKLSEKEKKDSKFHSRNGSGNRLPVVMLPSAAGMASGLAESGYVLRKSASCDSWSKQHQQALNSEIAEEYNEIDHIYDYVRGLTPLSKGLARFEPICESPTLKSHHTDSGSGNYCSLIRAPIPHQQSSQQAASSSANNNYSSLESNKHSSSNGANGGNGHHQHPHQHQHPHPHPHPHQHGHGHHMVNHYHHSHIQEDIKPVPPPIETIPGKKPAEKRQRPTLPKLYIKNANAHSAGSSSNGNSTGTGTGTATTHSHSHSHSHSHNHNHLQQQQQQQQQQLQMQQQPTTPNGNTANAVANAAAAAVAAAHHHGSLHNHSHSSHPHAHPHPHPHHGKVLTPNNHLPAKEALEPQSPLFHIRYKSLSSLQLTPDNNNTPMTPPTISAHGKAAAVTASNASPGTPPDVVLKCGSILNAHGYLSSGAPGTALGMPHAHSRSSSSNNHHNPREGTLDSSRSGGRTSGDSNKLPEKKTRRLSRPRSLSNLVWDLRPSKEKSKKKLYIHHFDQRQQATLYL